MSYSEVTPDEIRDRLADGEEVFLLDVREPDEIEEWAYPIGVNIPLGQLGTTDDCGFAPFADDTSTARDTAFPKIRATELAAEQFGR